MLHGELRSVLSDLQGQTIRLLRLSFHCDRGHAALMNRISMTHFTRSFEKVIIHPIQPKPGIRLQDSAPNDPLWDRHEGLRGPRLSDEPLQAPPHLQQRR